VTTWEAAARRLDGTEVQPAPDLRELAHSGDWGAYFVALRAANRAQDHAVVPQPPAEHSSRDPWPDGFGVPATVAKLRATVEAVGWDARVGYSRAWVKKGRGNVKADGSGAAWVRHHFVQLAVRRPGGAGCADAAIFYVCETENPLARWSFYAGHAAGTVVNATAWKDFVSRLPDSQSSSGLVT
jgi:hypothetical protein